MIRPTVIPPNALNPGMNIPCVKSQQAITANGKQGTQRTNSESEAQLVEGGQCQILTISIPMDWPRHAVHVWN